MLTQTRTKLTAALLKGRGTGPFCRQQQSHFSNRHQQQQQPQLQEHVGQGGEAQERAGHGGEVQRRQQRGQRQQREQRQGRTAARSWRRWIQPLLMCMPSGSCSRS